MADVSGSRYLQRLGALEEERRDWEVGWWEDVADFILPRRGFFSSRGDRPNEGRRNDSKIVDATATRALRLLAAGMQGGLTSPSRKWFRLSVVDDDLMQYAPVKEWLHRVETDLYRVFAYSNFYGAAHSVYTELAAFGTACLYEEEDPKSFVRFRALTAGEYSLAADASGRVDSVYRRIWMTARQMGQRFGVEKLSAVAREAVESRPDEWFEVLHAVQPREERDSRRVDRRNMPWESVYLEMKGDGHVLSEGGYAEFPYMAPRWSVVGSDVYGRSPGMDVLPDVKMLQEVQKGSIKAVHKQLDPPLKVPRGFKGPVRMVPGGINYVDSLDGKGIEPLFDVRFDIGAAEGKIDALQRAVREGLYNDLFLILVQGRAQMTAREVSQRHEEKLLLLGPVIERQEAELHRPVIERTMAIRRRQGHLPPIPEELHEDALKIDFIGLLSQAQKQVGTTSIQSTVDFVRGLGALDPAALDKLNMDAAVDEFADLMGVPPRVIRTAREVLEIRERRGAAVDQERAGKETGKLVELARELSETETGGRNALTDLMEALGEGKGVGVK